MELRFVYAAQALSAFTSTVTRNDPTFALPTLQIDNSRVRVTHWHFPPGAETGYHRHGMDYVVVPLTTGTLLLETPQGQIRSRLTAGASYTRLTGVEHNVVNANEFEFAFVEIELK